MIEPLVRRLADQWHMAVYFPGADAEAIRS